MLSDIHFLPRSWPVDRLGGGSEGLRLATQPRRLVLMSFSKACWYSGWRLLLTREWYQPNGKITFANRKICQTQIESWKLELHFNINQVLNFA